LLHFYCAVCTGSTIIIMVEHAAFLGESDTQILDPELRLVKHMQHI